MVDILDIYFIFFINCGHLFHFFLIVSERMFNSCVINKVVKFLITSYNYSSSYVFKKLVQSIY